MTNTIKGDVVAAIEWVIWQLNLKNEWTLLSEWDRIRGNDWIISTKLSEQNKNNE